MNYLTMGSLLIALGSVVGVASGFMGIGGGVIGVSGAARIKTGPDIGAKMPEFKAKDQNGKSWSSSQLLGPKGGVLVAYRSADWSPFCKAQLVELEQNVKQFEKLGMKVAALSYDSQAVLKSFADREGIHFPLLSDPDSRIIRALGILNRESPGTSPLEGVAYPGTYILDPKGVVTDKYFEEDYQQRYTAANILLLRFGVVVEPPQSEVEHKQLTASLLASNWTVRSGQRISLVLDLELKPTMHVYARGVKGYTPIEWKINDSPLATSYGAVYPKPETLFLSGLNETVPVYTNRVRLTREITIGQDDIVKAAYAKGQFSVEGKLNYQACDDKMCYFSKELPLKWSFRYEDFDYQRAPEHLQRKLSRNVHAGIGHSPARSSLIRAGAGM